MPKMTTGRGQEGKSFPCTHVGCNKSFSRSWDLRRHAKIHTGNRSHACLFPGCNKSFIQSTSLTVHMRTHTGERPYPCHLCGRGFSDSSSMNRHVRSHSGVKYFCCTYPGCSKSYCRRTTLRDHVKSRHVESYDPNKPIESMFLEPTSPLSACEIAPDNSTVVSISSSSPQPHAFDIGDDAWQQNVSIGSSVIQDVIDISSSSTQFDFSPVTQPVLNPSVSQLPIHSQPMTTVAGMATGLATTAIDAGAGIFNPAATLDMSFESFIPRQVDVTQSLFSPEFMSAFSTNPLLPANTNPLNTSWWTPSDDALFPSSLIRGDESDLFQQQSLQLQRNPMLRVTPRPFAT